MRLVLLGPPGAGKGTQAAALAAHLRVPAISTGDLFRAAVSGGSELGAAVRLHMAAGRLVSDQLTIAVVAERLARHDVVEGFLLDGFPRTLDQAIDLDAMLALAGTPLDGVLALLVNEDDVVRRLSGRRTCRGCGVTWHLALRPPLQRDRCDACGGALFQREDDIDAAIRVRLQLFAEQTTPLLDYYAGSGRLARIDASGTVEHVTATALDAVAEMRGTPVLAG